MTTIIKHLRVGMDGVCGLSLTGVKLSTDIFDLVPILEVLKGKMDVPKPAVSLPNMNINGLPLTPQSSPSL